MFGKNKYVVHGKITNWLGKQIPEDEPIFIIRAQDRLAPLAINAYADLLSAAGIHEGARDIGEFAYMVKQWQNANKDKVKDPD